MIKKIFIALLIITLVFFVILSFSAIPKPFPKSSQSALWLQNGAQKVLQKDFSLIDKSRDTPPNNNIYANFEGHPGRQFKITVWYPENYQDKPLPLIIYSHALASSRTDAKYIAQHLSSHGYIVFAADYPSTNSSAPGGALPQFVVDQPGDVRYFLDTILSTGNEIGDKFSPYIDQEKIAAMGISLGGMTSSLVAYHPTLSDSRIKAVVSIAGKNALFGPAFYKNNSLPFMMIAGDMDGILPYQYHSATIPTLVKNSVLVSIHGGTHVGFSDVAKYFRWMDNADAVTCFLINKVGNPLNDKSWYPQVGRAEQGIIYEGADTSCLPGTKYSKAINPLMQQMITKVATLSFLESNFSSDPARRSSASAFLIETLAREIDVVKIERSLD